MSYLVHGHGQGSGVSLRGYVPFRLFSGSSSSFGFLRLLEKVIKLNNMPNCQGSTLQST